jgi:endoglucanase
MVAYELMNEPVADDPEEWNQLIEKAYNVVRQLEPQRVLVFGSNRWQSVTTFDSLRVPENDKNILLSFHFYEPFLLTHHQASWTDIKDYKGPVYYPGVSVPEEEIKKLSPDLQAKLAVHNKEFNQNSMIDMLRQPLAKAKKYGLPLYCGEWGCYPTTPDSTRMQWYRDLRAVFDVYGIAWATWDYKGGFGIRDREGKPVENLINVLLKE